jgi:hypothetical protein
MCSGEGLWIAADTEDGSRYGGDKRRLSSSFCRMFCSGGLALSGERGRIVARYGRRFEMAFSFHFLMCAPRTEFLAVNKVFVQCVIP